MKIATFNANSIRSRQEVILDWLARVRPDALCVQETKACDEDFPAEAFRSAGWQVVFCGEKSYNGVALITREPVEQAVFGFDDGGPADETRLLRARLGTVSIVNAYVPQGRALDHPMFAYKLEWFARLRRYFERHFTPGEQVLWAGDLNVAAGPLDVHHPERHEEHVCYHVSVRQAFADCLAWGFTDVFRALHPEAGQYTFYDYRQRGALESGRGWRIDYILATKPLAQPAVEAAIDLEPRRRPKSSDHTFLTAAFKGGS